VEPLRGGQVWRTSPSPHGTAQQQDNRGNNKTIASSKTPGPISNTSSSPGSLGKTPTTTALHLDSSLLALRRGKSPPAGVSRGDNALAARHLFLHPTLIKSTQDSIGSPSQLRRGPCRGRPKRGSHSLGCVNAGAQGAVKSQRRIQ